MVIDTPMVAASRGALEIKRDLMHFYRLIIGVFCCGDRGGKNGSRMDGRMEWGGDAGDCEGVRGEVVRLLFGDWRCVLR